MTTSEIIKQESASKIQSSDLPLLHSISSILTSSLNLKDTLYQIFENLNSHYLSTEESYRKNPRSVASNTWKKWDGAYPEIISSLVLAYQGAGENAKAETVLNSWIARNPTDDTARKMLDGINK